ncbi:MAG: LytTR family DNA-binding domain-containing protein [Chitinophagaceae bacterium]
MKTLLQKQPNMGLSALIIDDEPDACLNLNILLHKYCGDKVTDIYQTTSTTEAEQLLKEKRPQVVFLDIEMPAENGFQFLERIGYRKDFYTVFVTAYDEYAIRAIKINALDYILKPVCEDELTTAVDKVWDLVNKIYEEPGLQELPLPSLEQEPKSIVLKSRSESVYLDFTDIISIEAVGSYCRFFYYQDKRVKKFLASHGLQYYQDLLPDHFFRTHKSYLINLKHFSGLVVAGSFELTMDDGSVVPLSRRRHAQLSILLEKKR